MRCPGRLTIRKKVAMPKICNAQDCVQPVWGKGYCLRHQYLRRDKKPVKGARFSVKRSAAERQYLKRSREWRENRPFCEIGSPVCTIHTQCVNHKKGKDSIEMLLNPEYWEASCFACNRWIEENDAWARAHGHKLSKHAK